MIGTHAFSPTGGTPASGASLPDEPGRDESVYRSPDGIEVTLAGTCRVASGPAGAERIATLYRQGGVSALAELDGPFVLSIRDPTNERVTLLRGPLGHRRLYYREAAGCLAWSTRLAPLAQALEQRRVRASALEQILNYRWNVGRGSVLEDVSALQPGYALTLEEDGEPTHHQLRDLHFAPEDPGPSRDAWVDDTERALLEDVRVALEGAERPVVLLSGGVDSSLLLALAAQARSDVTALTPTWADADDPELPRARRYAEHLGVAHEVLTLELNEAGASATEIVGLLEDVPHDHWCIALHAVFRRMAGRFDLALHGQAADTLFGDSTIATVRQLRREHALARMMPSPLRRLIGRRLPLRTGLWDGLRKALLWNEHTHLQRMSRVVLDPAIRELHGDVFGEGAFPDDALARAWVASMEEPERHQRFGLYTWGEVQLFELDTVSRANDLHLAFPYLGRHTLGLAQRLPRAMKRASEGFSKPLLRAVSDRYFPGAWAREPKLGFPTPTRRWMAGPLAPWLAERLGAGTWPRHAVGSTLDRLRLETDHEVLWTLAAVEELLRVLDAEPPPRTSGG